MLGSGTEPAKTVSESRDRTADGPENAVDARRKGSLGTLEGSEETAATTGGRILPAARQDAHIGIGTEPAVTMSDSQDRAAGTKQSEGTAPATSLGPSTRRPETLDRTCRKRH